MAGHSRAKLTPAQRLALVKRILAGHRVVAVSAAFGVSPSTARKWVLRFKVAGDQGLFERSSRPHAMPSRVADDVGNEIEALRARGLTYAQIAEAVRVPLSTVALICKRRAAADASLSGTPSAEPQRNQDTAT